MLSTPECSVVHDSNYIDDDDGRGGAQLGLDGGGCYSSKQSSSGEGGRSGGSPCGTQMALDGLVAAVSPNSSEDLAGVGEEDEPVGLVSAAPGSTQQ